MTPAGLATNLGELVSESGEDAVERLYGTGPEARFDRVLRLAAEYFGTRMGGLAIIQGESAWFKARLGFDTPEVELRPGSLTCVASGEPELLVVTDLADDPRFADYRSALADVAPPRFYVGAPVRTASGTVVGVFALSDPDPRSFDREQQQHFRAIADWMGDELSREEEGRRAADVQRALLPRRAIRLPGYQVAATCVPSRDVGGDLYDWYLGADGLTVTLADVMGKGVGAAIIAATVRASLRGAEDGNSPSRAMARTAALLEEDLEGSGAFVTAFYARLRAADGVVRYVDAGHGLALHIRTDGTWERLASGDVPLGISFGEGWTTHELQLAPGEMLLICSDGVLDLGDGTLGALDRVGAAAVAAGSASGIVGEIRQAALAADDIDDVTVVAIRREV